eukprot:3653602-Prymnesium_polylepis.1
MSLGSQEARCERWTRRAVLTAALSSGATIKTPAAIEADVSEIVGRRPRRDLNLTDAARRLTPSASLWITPGLCSTVNLYSWRRKIQRMQREAGPPSIVSRMVCSQRRALWSMTSLNSRPHK